MNRTKYLIAPVLILIALFGRFSAAAATLPKANNTDNLNLTSSWSGGVVPGSGDVALWDGTVTGANSVVLGADLSWKGLSLTSPGGAVTIGAGNTLTLGTSGIDLSTATQDLTISSGLTLGANNQTWTVATGRTLTHNTGTFSRSAGATLLVDKSTVTGTVTAGPTLVNSVVPWAVIKSSGTAANNSANGHTFATVSGGNIVAYTTATAVTTGYPANAATVNYDWSATGTQGQIGSSRSANTIRFTGSAAVVQQVNSTQTETMNALMNAGGGTVTLGGGAQTMNLQAGSANELVLAAMTSGIIINGPIINTSGGVTVVGPNTVTFGGANTYTGPTRVNSGTLKLGAANRIPDGSTVTVSGTLDMATFSDTIGGLDGAGIVDNSAAGTPTLTVNSTASSTYGGLIKNTAGTLALTKTGAGTLTLSGANNTYSGATTIGASGGAAVLRASATQALGSGSILLDSTGNASTARLETTGGISLNNAINFPGRNNSSVGIQSISGNNTLSGTITLNSGGSVYQIQSDAGTLTLGTAAATAITAASGARIATLQGAGNGLVAGNIINGGGTVSLTKTGAGTWTLAGTSSFTGPTTISQGTLALSGIATLASPQISIASGTIFDVSGLSSTFTLGSGQSLTNGTGSVNGSAATGSGSKIYPAASGAAGTLTFNNHLNLGAGGDVYLDVSTSYNSGNDQVVVGGDLTLSSSDTIHINALSGAANLDTTGDYVLFAVSGTTTMATAPVLVWDGTPPANQANYALALSGNNVVLQFSMGTAPTVTAAAAPSNPNRSQATTITATVTPGSGNIASVTANLTPIGGSSAASLVFSNNNVWTNTFTVSPGTTLGNKSLTITVTDDTSPTALTGTYLLALTVSAANQVWNGAGADDNWSSDANWTSGAAPVNTESVTFAGTTRLTPSMNANYSLTGVAFDATAGSFNVGTPGSTLTLTAGTGVINNSANPQTLTVPISMSAAQTFNAAAGDLNLGGNLTNGGNMVTIAGVSNITASGAITGGGGLTKTGDGTLTLSADNGFTGNLFAKAGAVVMAGASRISNGGNYSSIGQDGTDNATMTVKDSAIFTNTWDFNVGDIGGSVGVLNIQDGAVVNVQNLFVGSANAAGSTASGTINMTGGSLIVRGGTGMFSIGGRNSGNGGNGAGTINLDDGYIYSAGGLRVGDYGTGTVTQSGGLLEVTNASTGINLRRQSTGGSGTYHLNGGTLRTDKVTSSQTTGDRLFYFNGGILQAGNGNLGATPFMNNLSHAYVRDGGAIVDSRAYNIIISQALEHSAVGGDNAIDGGLTKSGTGTLTLSGVSTYTGPTVVSNGTLRVNGSIAGSGVTVVSGATLDGTGTVSTTVNVQSGGTLAPGTSIGTLALGAGGTLGGNLMMEISTPSNADKLDVTGGTLNFGGSLTLTNIGGALANGNSFNLFDGTLSGTFTTLNLPGGLAHWNISDLNVGGTITYINNNPAGVNITNGVSVGGSVGMTVIGKFVSALDADGDAVTITSVSTPASGTATIVGGTNITYVNTSAAATDSFTYTVSDGLGGTDIRTVTVLISSPEGFNKLSGPTGTGPYSFSYLGIPNEDYALDESPNLVAPYTWYPVVTNTASGTGAIEYDGVTLSYPSGSFRTRHVP